MVDKWCSGAVVLLYIACENLKSLHSATASAIPTMGGILTVDWTPQISRSLSRILSLKKNKKNRWDTYSLESLLVSFCFIYGIIVFIQFHYALNLATLNHDF